jgi:hypothetical protein
MLRDHMSKMINRDFLVSCQRRSNMSHQGVLGSRKEKLEPDIGKE